MAAQSGKLLAASLRLIVGLGNVTHPGTRHSVGQMAIAKLAQRHGAELKANRHMGGTVATVGSATLLIPSPPMNLNGASVAAARGRVFPMTSRDGAAAQLAEILVLHDDLETAVGAHRFVLGGGTRGHNGLRSCLASLHAESFWRLRLGIGRPPTGASVSDYVLSSFTKDERRSVDAAIDQAILAIETVILRR